MPNVISFVAEMTGQRDRDLLEVSLADVLFKLLGAVRLDLWRIVEHKSGVRARLLAGVRADEAVAVFDPMMDIADWPLVKDLEGVHECRSTGAPLRLEPSAGASYRHFFPVISERETVGVLEIKHAQPLTASQEQLVDGMLRIYRNHLALLDYSEHDTLTGLLNRKTFEDIFLSRTSHRTLADAPGRNIQLIGRRVPRPGEALWLAVVDIDFFKKINDRFGHVFGDEVLLLLARLMRLTFRASDTLFRFGGEEFVILLASTDADGAATAVERFRRAVEAYKFPQVGSVTISIGYCRVDGTEGPMGTFERADEALYHVKHHGRNQSCRYESLLKAGIVQPKAAAESAFELF